MNSIIISALLSFIEKELVLHEPDIQAAILAELQKGLDALVAYINTKLPKQAVA